MIFICTGCELSDGQVSISTVDRCGTSKSEMVYRARLNCLISIGGNLQVCMYTVWHIWSTVAIREIKILEMVNESQFVKYTSLENNHLYSRDSIIEVIEE